MVVLHKFLLLKKDRKRVLGKIQKKGVKRSQKGFKKVRKRMCKKVGKRCKKRIAECIQEGMGKGARNRTTKGCKHDFIGLPKRYMVFLKRFVHI